MSHPRGEVGKGFEQVSEEMGLGFGQMILAAWCQGWWGRTRLTWRLFQEPASKRWRPDPDEEGTGWESPHLDWEGEGQDTEGVSTLSPGPGRWVDRCGHHSVPVGSGGFQARTEGWEWARD